MDILFITDQNYLNPTAVSMLSVCESNKNENICFHILTSINSQIQENGILQRIASSYNQKCILYKQDFRRYEHLLPIGLDGMPSHCSIATYYRLFISDILPNTLDTVLYLDSDIIVRGQLFPLFQNPSSDVAIEGVIDNWEGDISKFNRLRYHPTYRYINAGVLLIHLNYWRNNDVLSSFLSFIKKSPERIMHHDQDIINYCLRDKKAILPYRYNVQDGFLMKDRNFLCFEDEEQLSRDIQDPSIIHYCSSLKPWHKECNHPYKDEFIKYMRLAGLTLKDFPKRKLTKRERIRALFIKCGIIKNNYLYLEGLRISTKE